MGEAVSRSGMEKNMPKLPWMKVIVLGPPLLALF